jgi:hypothetical protein
MSSGIYSVGAGYGAQPQRPITLAGTDYSNHEIRKGLDIRIQPAHGGWIVSIVNNSKDSELYIVSEDQDIGDELAKIVTMHYLKKEHP